MVFRGCKEKQLNPASLAHEEVAETHRELAGPWRCVLPPQAVLLLALPINGPEMPFLGMTRRLIRSVLIIGYHPPPG